LQTLRLIEKAEALNYILTQSSQRREDAKISFMPRSVTTCNPFQMFKDFLEAFFFI
jgi:hypothetical protein